MKQTIRSLLIKGKHLLGKAGLAAPELESELLLSEVLRVPRLNLRLLPDEQIAEFAVTQYESWIMRRASHEPIQYITGNCSFRQLSLKVTPDVLIPRPETEQLVDYALDMLSGINKPHVLELCTGSGAIAISLGTECPTACIDATDLSAKALEVAKNNGLHYPNAQIKWLLGDLYEPVKEEKYHMIIANPPYISWEDYVNLDKGVKDFEPQMALTDHEDGISIIQQIIQNASQHLLSPGVLLLEIGELQQKRIKEIFKTNKFFDQIRIKKDWSEKDRFLIAFRKNKWN